VNLPSQAFVPPIFLRLFALSESIIPEISPGNCQDLDWTFIFHIRIFQEPKSEM
jgi:hypothetical protein